MRRLAVLLVLCLLTISCARASDEPQATSGSYGSGVDLEGLDGERAPQPTDGSDAASGGTSGASGSSGNTQATPQPTPPPAVRASTLARDAGMTGQNALAYLRDSHPRLVLEITAVEGKAPPASTVDLLKQRLSEVVSKPQGIHVVQQTIPAQNTRYSMNEVREIEERYRKEHSDTKGPKVVMHLLYLNGQQEDPNVLGVAYRASSTVMFPDRFAAASNPVLSAEKIGRAVLIHEVGHILGLVNIGYRSPRDHEDPEHPGHSKNRGSVMYWAVESLDIANVLAGDVPTTFDADDKADLADRKAGKI